VLQPVFLNEVMIKDPSPEEPDSFTISHIDRVYNLRCNNQTERDNWVRHLRRTSKNYLDTEKKKREKTLSCMYNVYVQVDTRYRVVLLKRSLTIKIKYFHSKTVNFSAIRSRYNDHLFGPRKIISLLLSLATCIEIGLLLRPLFVGPGGGLTRGTLL